jgi:glutamine amidotransferase-like uncharacterized protein
MLFQSFLSIFKLPSKVYIKINFITTMPHKIFIYQGNGAGANSCQDLKDFFENHHLFNNRPDVVYTTFDENFDGLRASSDTLTMVLPGGNAYEMALSTRANKEKIIGFLNSGWNTVSVCAGGYLAGFKTELYKVNYKFNMNGFDPPVFNRELPSFGICADYNALGSFYPDSDHYMRRALQEPEVTVEKLELKHIYKPYCVSLNFENQQTLPALYVDGCAFEKIPGVPQQHTVAASYANNKYTFLNSAGKSYKSFEAMPAIIYRKAEPASAIGAVIASGVHFETCIENSRVLNYFANLNNAKTVALLPQEIEKLQEKRAESLAMYTSLMRRAFN